MSEESTDLVKGTEFTTVDNYDPKVKAKAYELFLNTDLDLTDIAIDLGISSKVVASWSRAGKWRDRKKDLEMELFNSAEDKYRALIVQKRVPTIERHLEVSQKIEEKIGEAVDTIDVDNPKQLMDLKRAAEAMSATANVSARAAAISDRPFSELDEDGKQKAPLITLNVQASVPPDAAGKARPIDVKVD